MPMRYATAADVLRQLDIADTDTASVDAVEHVENGLADAFDHKVGRTWGVGAVAETRDVTLAAASPRLITTVGIRDVVSIETGGTWDGAAWLDGETVPTTDYRLTLLDHTGLYWGIDALVGSWAGTVRVTATWGDQPELTVPSDVSAAVTFLTVRQYRRLTSSPQELIGPEGFTVPTPHGWDDPLVTAAIDRHRVVRMVV